MIKNNNIFLITRFNLYMADSFYENSGMDKSISINEKYLEKRFELFEKFCFPSIEAQTDKDFYWLVLFNSDTPDFFKQRIENLKNNATINFIPIFLKYYDIEVIKNKILELKNESNWVTSVRTDNDDILVKNFIEKIRELSPAINKTAINFEKGLHYKLDTQEIGIHNPKSNHFITYIEDISKNFELVYKCDHGQIYHSGLNKYINIKKEPMWVELIHGSNVANEFTSYPIAKDNDILDFINNFSKKKKNYKLFYKLKLGNKRIINFLGIKIKYKKRK